MKVSRRGCGVFRFLWPWEWDEPDGDKPSEAEDLTETFLTVLVGGVFMSYYWHCKEKGHVETDKQELLVGWLVSWWRKAGEKLRRHVIQKKQGDYQGNSGALNRMTGPPLWAWELTRSADCWYGRSYWKQGRWSCLLTWQPLPRGNQTGWDSSPLWEWLGELSFVSFFLNQFSSVTQSCLTLCEPMDCSTPGFPVHHQLPELAQTHVHWVSDAIQTSHPLSSPSPPAFDLSQHEGLFQWVSSSHQVAKVLELHSFSISPASEYSGLISFMMYWLVWSPCCPRDSQESSPTSQFKSISSSVFIFFYGPTLTSTHDYWKNHSFY